MSCHQHWNFAHKSKTTLKQWNLAVVIFSVLELYSTQNTISMRQIQMACLCAPLVVSQWTFSRNINFETLIFLGLPVNKLWILSLRANLLVCVLQVNVIVSAYSPAGEEHPEQNIVEYHRSHAQHLPDQFGSIGPTSMTMGKTSPISRRCRARPTWRHAKVPFFFHPLMCSSHVFQWFIQLQVR
jgi:hypothetical protein